MIRPEPRPLPELEDRRGLATDLKTVAYIGLVFGAMFVLITPVTGPDWLTFVGALMAIPGFVLVVAKLSELADWWMQ